jgi:hypothetical protein
MTATAARRPDPLRPTHDGPTHDGIGALDAVALPREADPQ